MPSCMLPRLESLNQRRWHLQYTGTVLIFWLDYSLSTNWFHGGFRKYNNVFKQLADNLRWFLTNDCFLRWAAGYSPRHKLTQAKMVNRPQLVLQILGISKVIFFSGDRRYIATGSYLLLQTLRWWWLHSRWTVDVTYQESMQAIIVCNHTDEFSFTTGGFAFLNCSNLMLKDLSFSQCSGVVLRLYKNNTDVLAFLEMNQSSVMFFSETLNLRLTNIVVTHYNGFAIIAANPYGSPLFQRLHSYIWFVWRTSLL